VHYVVTISIHIDFSLIILYSSSQNNWLYTCTNLVCRDVHRLRYCRKTEFAKRHIINANIIHLTNIKFEIRYNVNYSTKVYIAILPKVNMLIGVAICTLCTWQVQIVHALRVHIMDYTNICIDTEYIYIILAIYHFHILLQREEKVHKCYIALLSVLRNAITRNGGTIYTPC